MARKQRRQKYAPVRSVRIAEDIWNQAAKRAEGEYTTMSRVINAFVRGYAEGKIDLPTVKVIYSQPKADPGTGAA